MALTAQQQLALGIIPRVTAMMSVLGSSFIIYEVLKNPKKRVMAYHLQMLALSIADFLFSTTFFVGNWPAPDSGWCTANGFLGLLTAAPEAMLSAGVCVYYLLFVYFAWSEEKILRYQRVLIIFPIIWGLITAILPLAMGMINPHPVTGKCSLYLAPEGCTGSECTPDEYYYYIYGFVFLHIPRWISFAVAIISMCLVYYKVSKDEREQGGEAPAGWLWFIQREEGQDTSKNKRSRRMARQAFLYLLNFFLTYVGTTARTIVYAFGGAPSFGLLCFMYLFLPWQGFWNSIIYISPRYMRNREKNSNMSIWQAFMTEDEEYDHRLGARAMRSTVVPTAKRSFLGSMFRKSGQGQGQGVSQGESQGEGQGAEAEAEVELAQVAEEGDEEE
jgi:hypothetical protein